VELLLNLLWLSISVSLVALWARAIRLGYTRINWSTLAALALLLVLLLPVISMTDDLVAMAAPLEDDHPLRRGEMPLLHFDQIPAAPLDTVALAALLLLGLAFLATRLSRLIPVSYQETQRVGFARAMAVRPPPSALLAA
jgi:hypothetical protein